MVVGECDVNVGYDVVTPGMYTWQVINSIRSHNSFYVRECDRGCEGARKLSLRVGELDLLR